jgi:hypothetical protein
MTISIQYWPDFLDKDTLLGPIRDVKGAIEDNPSGYVECAIHRAKWWVPRQDELLMVWHALKIVSDHERYIITSAGRYSDLHQGIMEVRRRCERQMGLLIRDGKARGIYWSSEERSAPGVLAVLGLRGKGHDLDVWSKLSAVPSDDFEAAIELAWEAGSLTKTDVIRHLHGEEHQPPSDRSEWHHKKRRFDSNKAATSLAAELEACCTGLDLIKGDELDVLTKLEAVESIRGSIATIQKEIKKW